MAKRRRSKSRKNSNKSFQIFFITVIVIAILAFVITYLVLNVESESTNKGDNLQPTKTELENTETNNVKTKAPDDNDLIGTWASYNDGAMLTIKGNEYSIELPNVDVTIVGKGKVVIHDGKITFVNTTGDSECNIKPGVYSFTFSGNDEVTFKLIDDSCGLRSDRLAATWFKV